MKHLFFILGPLSIGFLLFQAVTNEPLSVDAPVHIHHVLFLRAGELAIFNIYILAHMVPYLLSFVIGVHTAVLVSPVIYAALFLLGMYLIARALEMEYRQKWLMMCLATALLLLFFPFSWGFHSYVTGLVFPLYLALFFKAVKSQADSWKLMLILATMLTVLFHPQLVEGCLLFLVIAAIAFRKRAVTVMCLQTTVIAALFGLIWFSQWGFYDMPVELTRGVANEMGGGYTSVNGMGSNYFEDKWLWRISLLMSDGVVGRILINGEYVNVPIGTYIWMQIKQYGVLLLVIALMMPTLIKFRRKEYQAMGWTMIVFCLMYTGYLLAISNDGIYILSRMYYFVPALALPLVSVTITNLFKRGV